MKKNTFAMISVTFILGAVFGISLFAVLSFAYPSAPQDQNAAIITIKAPEANHLHLNYLQSAASFSGKVQGFLIDRQQLDAMNFLANDKTLAGFRIYMAKGDKAEMLSIVVGVTAKNEDVTMGRIYKTQSIKTGPCPPSCDIASPITKD